MTPDPETGPGAPAAPPRPPGMAIPLSRPLFTQVFLGINVVVWLAEMVFGGSQNTQTLIRFGAKVNDLIVQGEYWRLLTATFLHAGIAHLALNMYALLALGLEVERLFGRSRFLVLYLLAGLYGSMLSFDFGAPISVGASGAIFGLAGALMAFLGLRRKMLGKLGRQQFINITAIIAINLFIGFSLPGIDNLGHLGGLIAGLAIGWRFAPDYQVGWDVNTNLPMLYDRNSLPRQWLAVAVAIVVLIGGTAFGVAWHSFA